VSDIKHNGGRPKKDVKRDSVTGVRFTKAEYFIVKQKARKAGFKITQYIRVMALNGKIIARFTEEEKQFIRQLIGMANNINQITKLAHKEKILTAILHFEEYRTEFDLLLKQLKNDQ